MRTIITALTVMMMLLSCIGDEDINGNGDGKGWEKEWGSEKIDTLNAIAVGPDDTIYVGGETWGNLYSETEGDRDAFFAVFNPKGDELFGKQWAVNDGRNDVQGLVVDDEGNIYVGGGQSSFIIKFSSDGTKIWERSPEVDSVSCLALDRSGNVYAGTGYGDILKFSPDGKELWHHNISTEKAKGQINALAVDSEGNIYAGGKTGERDDLFGENAGGRDAFLVKIAPDKTHIWEKQWGGTGDDRVYSLAVDNMNNIYVAGGTTGTNEILLKYSSDGKKLWGNEGSVVNYNSMVLDDENNLYVGIGYNKNLVEKYNSDGKKTWDTNDEGKWEWGAAGIALDSYGNLYICGGKNSNYLIKIPASEME